MLCLQKSGQKEEEKVQELKRSRNTLADRAEHDFFLSNDVSSAILCSKGLEVAPVEMDVGQPELSLRDGKHAGPAQTAEIILPEKVRADVTPSFCHNGVRVRVYIWF